MNNWSLSFLLMGAPARPVPAPTGPVPDLMLVIVAMRDRGPAGFPFGDYRNGPVISRAGMLPVHGRAFTPGRKRRWREPVGSGTRGMKTPARVFGT